MSESLGENLDIGTPGLKQVDVEPKWFMGSDGRTIQVRGAENEWPRPIAHTARTNAQRRRLENLRVSAPTTPLALPDVPASLSGALAYTMNFSEDSAQCASQHIAGAAVRKVDPVSG
jgi:hypothetical protein